MIIGKDCVGVGCWGIIIRGNETLLIKRRNRDVWERPGGKLEVGETFEECLHREIKEETNIQVIPETIQMVQQIYSPEQDTHWVCIGYLCKYRSGEAKLLETDKHKDIGWFDIDDLPKTTEYTRKAIKKYLENK